MTNNRIKNKIRTGLRYSFLDGAFASAMVGFTQDYLVPFILLLKGTVREVAFLNALPNLLAAFIQLKAADLTEWARSRKKIVNFFVFLQAVSLVPMILMCFVRTVSPSLFIVNAMLFNAFGVLTIAAWGSWMTDLIPRNKRGKYFGWRNRILGFVLVASSFVAGTILSVMKEWNIFLGFAAIFTLACAFRVGSWYFLEKIYEPRMEYKKEHRFGLVAFVLGMRKRNFAKFVLFTAMMNFSVNLASPFFSVLMLRDLHFGYLLYTFIVIMAPFTMYIMMERWGVHADKIGNFTVIKFVSPIIAILPLLWIMNRHPVFLVFAQIVSGFAWGGFNLCATNYVYDAVTPGKRTRCLAYFNAFNAMGLCLGALIGGFLQEILPPLMGNKILMLLLFSFFVRLAVSVIMPKMVKEVRPVRKVRTDELLFSVVGLRPIE